MVVLRGPGGWGCHSSSPQVHSQWSVVVSIPYSAVKRYRPEPKRRPTSKGLGWLLSFEGKPITVPQKFRPDLALADHAWTPLLRFLNSPLTSAKT